MKCYLNIRKSGNIRWIDQKCTPDVVCFIADCVLNYVDSHQEQKAFVVNDIWNSEYFNENVQAVFSKPDAQNEGASSEYDKFIQQPLRMLGYAQILSCVKKGSRNIYSIQNYDLLNFIASKERNAYRFLYEYIVKVLRDSNMLQYFEDFKALYEKGTATKSDFHVLKTAYEDFILANTPINTRVEIRRIFTKVINPYACENKIAGTEKGHMADHVVTFSELMYNRLNWRDIGKQKGMTRQEFEETVQTHQAADFNQYLINKAMGQVRRKYVYSEVSDEWANDKATEVHHIFMKHEFPQIADYMENMIKLTPTQHRNHAHPNSNYRIISRDYQYICLIAKSNNIEISLSNNEDFYSTENFVYVVNTGLTSELPNNSSLKYVREFLAVSYNQNLSD